MEKNKSYFSHWFLDLVFQQNQKLFLKLILVLRSGFVKDVVKGKPRSPQRIIFSVLGSLRINLTSDEDDQNLLTFGSLNTILFGGGGGGTYLALYNLHPDGTAPGVSCSRSLPAYAQATFGSQNVIPSCYGVRSSIQDGGLFVLFLVLQFVCNFYGYFPSVQQKTVTAIYG